MASSCPFRHTWHDDLFLNLTFLNRALWYTYVIRSNKMLTFYINDLINYAFDMFRTSKFSSLGRLVALSPWLKWPVCESDKISPSSANVKNERTYNALHRDRFYFYIVNVCICIHHFMLFLSCWNYSKAFIFYT